MFLLDDILLFPLTGTAWVIDQIIKHAEAELYDPQKIKKELMETRFLYEMGEISEKEYKIREANLFERLRKIKETEEGEG